MPQQHASPSGGSPGDIYERLLVPAIFAPWARDLVALAAVQPGERVLDLACGTGVVARAVAAQRGGAGEIVGLDRNPGMLATARAVAADLPIEWREGDATALPFADGAFEVVLCQQGLQFFPDQSAALAEVHRVLAAGGRALLSVWRPTRDIPGWRALEEALARHVGPRAAGAAFSLGDARALRALLEGGGFRDIRIRSEVRMSRFPSAEAFVRAAVANAPTILGPLAAQGEAGLAQIVAEVAADLATSLDDEGLAFPQASNIAVARKG